MAEYRAQSGDLSFATAGLEFSISGGFGLNPVVRKFGSGVEIDFDAGEGEYLVSSPTGDSSVFRHPEDRVYQTQDTDLYNDGAGDSLRLFIPEVDGVYLTYTMWGLWGSDLVNAFAAGIPTFKSDVPTMGSASYSMAFSGEVLAPGIGSGELGEDAGGTFIADFGAGTVTLSIDIQGTYTGSGGGAFDWGTVTGSGALDSGGPGFSGALAHANGGDGMFSGAFFGPEADELGYAWLFTSSTFSARGLGAGKKD